MQYENLKYDFPKMPEEMRDMIEREVEKQVKVKQQGRKRRFAFGKIAAASAAAVMLCGTTVFAGVRIYEMRQEKIGEHGVSVDITAQENAKEENPVIPNVKMEIGYLPEGMVETEQGKYSFSDALNKGGISMVFYRMNTGDDKFEVQHGDVLSSEEFTANGHSGVYLEYPNLYQDDISFNQRIYVEFTDVHYVMEMYAASDVSKEEALKIAENVKLVPTEDANGDGVVTAQNWSSYEESMKESGEGEGCKTITSVAKEEMKNTHSVGESFPANEEGLTVKVSDVKIADDFSLLDASLLDEDFRKETDENGKLRPAVISYVKAGDMDALSQEVKSREVPQKLVYATVEYTNTGKEEMKDVLFLGDMVPIYEAEGQMQIVTEEMPKETDEWEMAVNRGMSAFREMVYYDVHGGERHNNYIESIKPGETATVHMAWVVTEEELGNMYLSFDTTGGCEFTETSLKLGYVDIRQQ
ncbi:MAG: DUF4367 domain-containing protein [Lachnospiraceae bacterium]|jgi:hypothetical protein|nr:DUF4367 domain-containing protein [Lachnospiraceae bacterium]